MSKGSMSSKERLLAALEGRETDHVPFSPNLAYAWDYFPEEIRKTSWLEFQRMIGCDPLWRAAPCPAKIVNHPDLKVSAKEDESSKRTFYETPVGTVSMQHVLSPEGKTWFLVEHPLKTEADFKVWTWIEEKSRVETDMAHVNAHKKEVGDFGLSIGMLIPRGGKSAFQHLVEVLVGTEELCYSLADFPSTVEELLSVMKERDMDAVNIVASSGAYEWHITWEDSSTQNYSPSMYSSYIASEIGEWCKVLNSSGMKYIQHACGHVKDILGGMFDSGIDAIESVSPPPTGNMPLKDVRKIAGSSKGIIGGIEPTLFLNLGIDELPGYVEQVVADGKGGPFILANSDSCPPGVSVEKFKLISDLSKDIR